MVQFSESLGEWTAAQITDLNNRFGAGKAGVLELDWSGPEPKTLTDLGELRPLLLTHHSWNGSASHCYVNWLLPRGARVIGRAQLLI